MKSLLNMVGILLVILGILVLSYQGYQYTQYEEVAKLGDLKLVEETQKRIQFPPILGGASLGAGLLILLISRIRK